MVCGSQVVGVTSPLLPFQVKLLQSLGLKSTLITDGNSPINLFNTASGLLGGATTSGALEAPEED